MRTPPQKAKSDADLQAVIQATQKLWRRHHLSYDQTRYVAKQARRALELKRPQVRARIIERLSRDEERRLIETAYKAISFPVLKIIFVKSSLNFHFPATSGKAELPLDTKKFPVKPSAGCLVN
jgi:hypothetical protein